MKTAVVVVVAALVVAVGDEASTVGGGQFLVEDGHAAAEHVFLFWQKLKRLSLSERPYVHLTIKRGENIF